MGIIRVLAGLAVTALLVTACGSDSEEGLSKDDYVEQANAISAATNAELDPIVEEFFSETFEDVPADTPPDAVPAVITAFDEFFDEVLTPAFEEQMDEIEALAPPAEDADMLDELYDDLDSGLETVNTTLDDAVAGDVVAIEAFSSGASEEQLNEANRQAREYGLTVCGEEG